MSRNGQKSKATASIKASRTRNTSSRPQGVGLLADDKMKTMSDEEMAEFSSGGDGDMFDLLALKS